MTFVRPQSQCFGLIVFASARRLHCGSFRGPRIFDHGWTAASLAYRANRLRLRVRARNICVLIIYVSGQLRARSIEGYLEMVGD